MEQSKQAKKSQQPKRWAKTGLHITRGSSALQRISDPVDSHANRNRETIMELKAYGPPAMSSEQPTQQQEGDVAKDLVQRIQAGDRSAEDALVRRYRDGLIFVLSRRVNERSNAEDLAQEALILAITKLRQQGLEEPTKLANFMHGIAKNLAIANYRKQARQKTDTDSELVERIDSELSETPARSLSQSQSTQIVRTLLAELPVERDRQILMRLFVYDQDRSLICQELGIEPSYFNRVLFRAKARFKSLVESADKQRQLSLID